MRILWVNHFAVSPDRGGGTRQFELGRELVRRGHDVHIVASDLDLLRREFTRRTSPDDRRTVREEIEGVHFWWCWSMPYRANDWRRIANWLTFAWQVVRAPLPAVRPDVVIGSSPHLFAALGAWVVARRARARFVFEVRDLWPESLQVAGVSGGPAYAMLAALARFLYARADRVLVLTEGVADYLRQRGVAAERIVVAPNGVEMRAFAPQPPRGNGVMRLVYAGAHGPANDLGLVLDAAGEMQDEPVEFVLLGDGPEKPALVRSARERGLRNVAFHDPVPKAEIPDFLAGCDAGLMVLRDVPLFAFGVSPNKLFDYWGAGLPVVNAVSGEVAGYVAQSGGGVQATAGGAGLAEAIRTLQRMPPEQRRALGDAGRRWVERTRDRGVVASIIEEMLQSLVHRR